MGKITQIKCSKELVYAISETGMFIAWNYIDCVQGPIEFNIKFPGFDIREGEILVFGKSNILLYNYETSKPIARSEAHEWFGAFLPDSRILALSAKENILYLLSSSGDDLITQFPLTSFQSSIKQMKYSGHSQILLNCSDRTLRIFEIQGDDFVSVKDISDYIERKRWTTCCFFQVPNLETEFIIGCLQESGSHTIRMYDTTKMGYRVSLAKNMSSPLGAAVGLCSSLNTHIHPVICVVAQSGALLLWSSGTFERMEKWSTALSLSNFTQLEEDNVEYEELEDEFDKFTSTATALDLEDPEPVISFKLV